MDAWSFLNRQPFCLIQWPPFDLRMTAPAKARLGS